MRRCVPFQTLLSLGLCLIPTLISAEPLTAAIEQLATQLAMRVPEGRTLPAAISEFPDLEGVTSNMGRFVAERLSTRLGDQKSRFRLVERRRLAEVLAELKYSQSDLVDPSHAVEVGRALGVEALIVGTITEFERSIAIDARLIEVETNRILSGLTVTASKDVAVTRMLREGRPAIAGVASSPGEAGILPAARRVMTPRGYGVELLAAETVGRTLRVHLAYTCLRDRPCHLYPPLSAFGGTYIVDTLGYRYRLVATSCGEDVIVTVPPKLTTREWLAFETPRSAHATIHLVVGWALGQFQFKNLSLRNDEMPRR